MAFTEINFVVWFIPIFLTVYYFAGHKLRNIWLLVGSIAFLSLGDYKAAILLGFLTLLNYELIFGIQINNKSMGEVILFCFVVINLGVLLFYKYYLHSLPLGISFYTFMAIASAVDIWKGKAKVKNLLEYATYIFMFPKLIQGPIVPFTDVEAQLRSRRVSFAGIEHGLERFVIGLAFKVLIADRMGMLWTKIQSIGYESISTPTAWIGLIACSLELYFDFQGYSLMAIGLGQMLGFKLPKNFDHPYHAKTIGEFYRRWHITLGKWFKEYIYIPLGGNKKGLGRTLFNIFVVWLLTGIWHGTGINFILWAMILCFFICIEKMFLGKFLNKHAIISRVYIWAIIPLTWVVFFINDLGDILSYFCRLFGLGAGTNPVHNMDFMFLGWEYILVVAAAFIVSLPAVEKIFYKVRDNLFVKIVILAIFWFCMYEIKNIGNNPFLYTAF